MPEASRVLRIGRQLGYQLAHEYLASGGTSGLPRGSIRTKEPARAAMGTERTRRDRSGGPTVRRRIGGSEPCRLTTPSTSSSSGLTLTSCVAVSIRSLAASLGLTKDTIARSVRRLRDAGLVSSIQRRDTSGTFAAGSYRLAVSRSCLSLVSLSVPVAGVPAESLVRPARRSSGQLALFLEV